MFLIPYCSDARLYHWPVVTVVLIALNVAFYAGAATGNLGTQDDWIVTFGNGLHPVEWLSNNFMHADPGHLFFNMVFLWSFGLVVEGKLGPWKYLATYLIVAVVFGALVQVIMLGYQPPPAPFFLSNSRPIGALGASAVIFGLMMMALVWAPRNSMDCVFIFFVRVFFFQWSILWFSAFYLGMNALYFWLDGFNISSEALHLLGAGVGLAAGLVLLRTRQVDCEGWDIFSVLAGKREDGPEKFQSFKERERSRRKRAEEQERKRAAHQQAAAERIRKYLADDNPRAAHTLYRKTSENGGAVPLEPKELSPIVRWLHEQRRWSDSVALMTEWIRQRPDASNSVRLKLAQILIQVEKRPGAALEVLDGMSESGLTPKSATVRERLRTAAEKLQATVDLELDASSR